MSRGEVIQVERMSDSGTWLPHLRMHLLQANKTKSSEYVTAGGEQASSSVTFRVRWNKHLPDIERDMPRYRIIWRGVVYDIRGVDDFMYRRISVDIVGVAYADA